MQERGLVNGIVKYGVVLVAGVALGVLAHSMMAGSASGSAGGSVAEAEKVLSGDKTATMPLTELAPTLFGGAARGDAQANLLLGHLMRTGTYLPYFALHFYQQAAAGGDADAAYELANLYKGSKDERLKNLALALKYMKQAADDKKPEAVYALAFLYLDPEAGQVNTALALQYFREAAELGVKDANFDIGYSYENGRGIVADLNEAKKYYEKAGSAGNAQALERLKQLAAQPAAETVPATETAPAEAAPATPAE